MQSGEGFLYLPIFLTGFLKEYLGKNGWGGSLSLSRLHVAIHVVTIRRKSSLQTDSYTQPRLHHTHSLLRRLWIPF
jgi:hypothetical protein